ncbi:hypothetical protein PU629_06975 [Pullulanibacillus sp. KACC 23026]|uniref:hypothetical protein n=1 Tax=Pullulanibacillus sp. KACC 23026 TaxID=3028315 RepID=UPI0023B1C001|nr:hypothetical protein [Pullulanibacillus sp. KACC 23026]WEG14103.1 hypothetical protein PU629_06975 [Pullulanibacillus sp. KACC 23026]
MTKLVSHVFGLRDINVNSIANGSGIFIGETNANYWESHVKENFGVGHITHSTTRSMIGVVQDNDLRDMTHIEKNTIMKQRSTGPNELKDIEINIDGVHINNIAMSSSVSTGAIEQDLWRTTVKNNYGTGQFLGINHAESLLNLLNDQDIVDQYNDESTNQSSVQTQEG